MGTSHIIAQIDEEISRLQQVKDLLIGSTAKHGPGRPAAPASNNRQLSPEARARIAAAQKARWARARKAGEIAAVVDNTKCWRQYPLLESQITV
ncbi:MAG TPA: hypothetical protein VGM27_08555 [Acidobacteriaceae bacterium]|jgi:hypothetical protein